MNNNNNNSQGGVPDQRLEQLNQRLREMEMRNSQLQGQIEMMAKAGYQQPKQQQQQAPRFAPEVEQAIQAAIEERLRPLQEQFQQQMGYTYDQIDEMNFMQKYGKPQYEPYLERVDQLRREAQMRGQWMSRADALKFVYFDETGKKPAPENTQQAQAQQEQPKFDAFLGQYVDAKGNIVPPPGVVDPDKLMREAMNPQQPQQMQQFQGQPQMPQQMPQQFQQFPQQQPQQMQQFQLPNGNPPEQMQAAPPTGQHFVIDVTSTDQALQAWENKYGDIPL